MRKFFAVLLVLLIAAIPAYSEDAFVKQVQIGKDRAGLTWYLTDYGSDYSTPYAVARKYYTNQAAKREQIDLLISRYAVPDRQAQGLYFTEYRYEYTPDGRQFAEVSRRHFDMQGREIYGLERNASFSNVVKNSIMSKGYAYAVGKLRK